MENEEVGSYLFAMGKEKAEVGSRLNAKEKEKVDKWMEKEDGGIRLDVKEENTANDDLRWSEELIGKMGESREEDEVAQVKMPIVIGEKNRAREINPKILGFIFSSGRQLCYMDFDF